MVSIDNLTVSPNDSLIDVLRKIDKFGKGTAFVIDEEKKIQGVVTDGDIRRAILEGIRLSETIDKVMNQEFVYLNYNATNSEILSLLNDKIKIIPLLNEKKELVDYASIQKLHRIPIASPLLDGNELSYISECIKTSWISSQGKYVKQFEKMFETLHEGYTALAVCNGTVALHLALEALDIGKGDEVLVPNLTFVASVNAIIYTGATPVLVDIDPETLNIDVECAKKSVTSDTKAIMPVHLYGQPCDMERINKLASAHDLYVVEDTAEALGSTLNGKRLGTFSDAATFSFFGNKTITTGEGGMVLFKDKNTAKFASILRDHGMDKEKRYWHNNIGYNYRMTNLQAAVGVAQMERLDEFVKCKRRISQQYNEILSKFDCIQLPKNIDKAENSYWLYTFLIKESALFNRDELIKYLKMNSIEARPLFYPISEMPPYQKFKTSNKLNISKMVARQGISLPTSPNLTELEVEHVSNTIANFITKSYKTQ